MGDYYYQQQRDSERYIKWFHDHDDDMDYRYNRNGKQIYTRLEIVELGETDKIRDEKASL